MRYFDLHADTPTKLYYRALPFSSPELDVSANDLTAFSHITQVFACFCNEKKSDDEAYRDFFRMRENLFAEIAPYIGRRFSFLLAVEDARLLAGDIRRLSVLRRAGVSLLTLVWRGESCVGGAYDTDRGLTAFGQAALTEALRLGIIPDLSHASDRTFYDAVKICTDAGSPFIATHSDARAVCRHPRNLTDEEFMIIRDAGGIVGLCLCPEHLTVSGVADEEHFLLHLEHYLALGGENTVCLGTDLDGISSHPAGVSHLADMARLIPVLQTAGYSDALIRNLFYKNAENFFRYFQKAGSQYELQKHKK